MVCAPVTAAASSRVDSRATGSALFGSAMSSWNASQRLEQAPAEPPLATIRVLSICHSAARLRTVCKARAASESGASTGGSTPASIASLMNRYSVDTTDTPAVSSFGSMPVKPLIRSPPCQPPPWMKKSSGAGLSAVACGVFQKCNTCLG